MHKDNPPLFLRRILDKREKEARRRNNEYVLKRMDEVARSKAKANDQIRKQARFDNEMNEFQEKVAAQCRIMNNAIWSGINYEGK